MDARVRPWNQFYYQQALGKDLRAALSPNSLKRTQIQDINQNLPHPLSQTIYFMETTASLKKKKKNTKV